MQRITSAVFLLFALGVTTSASADTLTVDGDVGAPGSGADSVSVHYFSVSDADDVSVSVATESFFNADGSLNEDYIRADIYLFTADGTYVADAQGAVGAQGVSLEAALAAGDYVLVIGDAPMTLAEAQARVNEIDGWDLWGLLAFDGNYTVTITADNADLSWTGGTPHSVPELTADSGGAALLLLVGGLTLLSGRRRRRVAA